MINGSSAVLPTADHVNIQRNVERTYTYVFWNAGSPASSSAPKYCNGKKTAKGTIKNGRLLAK